MRIALPLLAVAAFGIVWCDEIPKHPRELKYPPLKFTPPHAADFRHKLASGATAYLVEDHELPLVHISVLVRTGVRTVTLPWVGATVARGDRLKVGITAHGQPKLVMLTGADGLVRVIEIGR